MSPMRLWRTLAAWLVLCGVAAQPLTESLRIPMPPWSLPPWVLATQSDDGGMMWEGGFVVDMWKLLGEEMGLRIEFVAVGENNKESQANFSDEMHSAAYSDAFDGVSWDVVPPVMRPGYVYTLALFNLEDAIILRRKVVPVKYLEVFTPFDDAVWGVLFASVVTGGLFLLLLSISYTDGPLAILSRYPTYVYHTAIALFGGDDFDEYHLPTGGRVFRFGLLVLAMMWSATYTANLAAFLVRPKYKVHGPRTFEELKRATICYRFPEDHLKHSRLRQYVGKMLTPPLASVELGGARAWSVQALKDGACDGIAYSRADAHLEVLADCDNLVLADMTFSSKPLMALVREDRPALARRINNAILIATRSPAYAALLARYARYNVSCEREDELPPIGLTHMAVPFFVFAVCAVLAVLVTVCERMMGKGRAAGTPGIQTKEEAQNAALKDELGGRLDELLSRVDRLAAAGGYAAPPLPADLPPASGRGGVRARTRQPWTKF